MKYLNARIIYESCVRPTFQSPLCTEGFGFPGGSAVKNLPANEGDMGSISGSGRPPGEGNDNPLQYSCLRNPMYRGLWWAIVHGVAKELDTTERLNNKANVSN